MYEYIQKTGTSCNLLIKYGRSCMDKKLCKRKLTLNHWSYMYEKGLNKLSIIIQCMFKCLFN